MSLTDFLFESKAPPAVTSTGTTSTNLPQWLQDYTQSVIAKANIQGAEEYQSYGGPRVAGFNQDQQGAFSGVRGNQGVYKPLTGSAASRLGSPNAGNNYSTARNSLTGASGRLPEGITDYLNPYVDNVTNRAQELATRTWNEDIMPGINDIFVRGGTYASSPMADKLIQGGRGVVEGLQRQAGADLAGAYESSAGMFQNDQNRLANIGQIQGSLAGDEGRLNLDTSRAESDLGALLQKLGLTDASSLEAIGKTQQNQVQKNYDTAYGDFREQRDYPQAQLEWMMSLLKEMPNQGTVSTAEQKPLPGAEYQPSELNQLLSTITGVKGLYDTFTED
jgi:hypothetical protein